MLIDYVREGQQIASDCHRSGKFVAGVKDRYASWLQSVEEHLKGDPVTLARFRNAQPVPDLPADIVTAQWQKLQGQLAVLVELARERGEAKPEEVFALKPTRVGVGDDLKAAWRKIVARWHRGRREPL